MSDYYVASDYAGLIGGQYSFYYGYERTNGEDDWLFVANVDGNIEAEWTAEELEARDHWNCAEVLMAGIARFLEELQACDKENEGV